MTQGRDQSQGALLPCPFCGAAARTDLLPYPEGPGWVQCSSCECHQNMTDTLDEAVRRWNTRAPVFAPAAQTRWCSCKASERDGQHMAWCPAIAPRDQSQAESDDPISLRRQSAEELARQDDPVRVLRGWAKSYRGGPAKYRFPSDPHAEFFPVDMDAAAEEIERLRVLVEGARACAQFVRWALQEGSWQGCDLDGGSVQDKAEALGLISKVPYDPAKHGESEYAEPGSDWYVPTDALTAMALPSTELRRG